MMQMMVERGLSGGVVIPLGNNGDSYPWNCPKWGQTTDKRTEKTSVRRGTAGSAIESQMQVRVCENDRVCQFKIPIMVCHPCSARRGGPCVSHTHRGQRCALPRGLETYPHFWATYG